MQFRGLCGRLPGRLVVSHFSFKEKQLSVVLNALLVVGVEGAFWNLQGKEGFVQTFEIVSAVLSPLLMSRVGR